MPEDLSNHFGGHTDFRAILTVEVILTSAAILTLHRLLIKFLQASFGPESAAQAILDSMKSSTPAVTVAKGNEEEEHKWTADTKPNVKRKRRKMSKLSLSNVGPACSWVSPSSTAPQSGPAVGCVQSRTATGRRTASRE